MLVWISAGLAISAVTGIGMLWRKSLQCGRIEGVLFVDGQPAPEGTIVAGQITDHEPLPCSPMCFTATIHNRYAETSRDGTFVFKQVRAGDVMVGRCHGSLKRRTRMFGLDIICDDEECIQIDCEQLVVVAAGTCVRVVLGKDCRTVRGCLVIPEELQFKQIDSMMGSVCLVGDAHAPETPDGIDLEARAAWWKEVSQTEEGIAWREAISRSYHVTPDANGDFMHANVRPGCYIARIISGKSFAEDVSAGMPKWDVGETEAFVVPVANDSMASAVVDLGDLPVFLRIGRGMPETD